MKNIMLHIPWKYKEGDKIGDINFVWSNSIIDNELSTDRCKSLLKCGSYWIQCYPGDDSIVNHTMVDMNEAIAKILHINHNGIIIELTPKGYSLITKSMYSTMVAIPKMLHDGNKIMFIGNIYLVYKTEDGEYKYV